MNLFARILYVIVKIIFTLCIIPFVFILITFFEIINKNGEQDVRIKSLSGLVDWVLKDDLN